MYDDFDMQGVNLGQNVGLDEDKSGIGCTHSMVGQRSTQDRMYDY
jgi:hypothetical protein